MDWEVCDDEGARFCASDSFEMVEDVVKCDVCRVRETKDDHAERITDE